MAISSTMPFRGMPHQTNLFLSYLDMSPQALAFYHHPARIDEIQKAARTKSGRRQFHREQIASILRKQNLNYETDTLTFSRIEELRDPECVAVITGQQVGLFTGPLYTIYKAFSAIRVAEHLRGLGIRAVPIFWMDTEDHDLAEVTARTTLAGDFSPIRLDSRQLLFGKASESMQSVGSIQFPESVRRLVQESIPLDGPKYANDVLQDLASAYKAKTSFSEAFARLMARLFKGHGLILFDPMDVEAKKLLIPIYRGAAEQAAQIESTLLARNAELESAGFHAQVNIVENSTVLFYQERGNRRPLTRSGAGFAVKGSGALLSQNELIARIDNSPEPFSPNVLLRPIVQDYLFPTVAYVAGPAEIAYFAQIEVLYRIFGFPMPVIWPRCSFTLMESEIAEKLIRYGLDFADCFGGKEQMIEKAVNSTSRSKAGVVLDRLRQEVETGFAELYPGVAEMDPTLGPAMETAKRKIFHHLHAMKIKFTQLDALQDGTIFRDVDAILNYCYPNRNFQERELCIVDFLARQGPALMDIIYHSCEVGRFTHRIIRLES
jgi:bacillithiol biosynthesis cysteine-adding enzyme BshC